ncbi:PEP-CTERM sorting domain-containing protein [Niveibacterium sp. 24ML]|uniref:PEP-CTERM sorting domain-containing protein n=1 Tax=Niveibacterium sp. 24ML TaxID=2985512 RepID=UPI0022711B5D|nr:PEP-CTERM sorting domain-containing protein [Niveibacterium sp. 24ML]MCX9158496.1 PEP-CTERM sorting domain-containing protein [Niveibacterium sp. 24ML]
MTPARLGKTFAVLLVSFACLAGTANAGLITTTTYKEDPYKSWFKWGFVWDGSTPGVQTRIDAPGHGFWWPSISFFAGADKIFNDLDFFGQHMDGPHALDVDPGGLRSLTAYDISGLAVSSDFKRLLSGSIAHFHTPRDHRDYYDVFYSRQTGQAGASFLFQGTHVPEPSSLYLIGLVASLSGIGFLRGNGKHHE